MSFQRNHIEAGIDSDFEIPEPFEVQNQITLKLKKSS